ncbi:MAG: leucine-rich repeat protein [Eubacteriales bacterium]|nr:leucine-rich repeat protein [Eubacteriales bacterium]
MKHLIALTLSILLLLVPCLTANAYWDGGFEYTVEDGKATITAYTGSAVGLAIPDTLGGYPVVAIGDEAFSDCLTLRTISIPLGIESIGEFAFSRCFFIESITIPSSVVSIGSGAFRYCYKLNSISAAAGNPVYSSLDGVLFDKDKTVLVKYPTGSDHVEYTIPSSVITIGDWAFNSCSELERVNLNSKLLTIGVSAFSACNKLDNLIIPEGVTQIEAWAFSACSSLADISLPSTMQVLGEGCFMNCSSLESIVLPDSIDYFEDLVFSGCALLQAAYFEGSTPLSFGEKVFDECHESFTIYYHVDLSGIWSPNGETEYSEYPIAPYGTHTVLRGDANFDKKVTASDAAHILRYVVFLVADEQIDLVAADVNNSGAVTSADAARILRWIVKLEDNLD